MSLLGLLRMSYRAGSASPLPAPADATIAAIRPSGRRIGLLIVDPAGGGTHTTIQAALTAAAGIQSAKLAAEGGAVLTPNYRVDVLVRPGTYSEILASPPWVGVYGVAAADGTRPLVTWTIADASNGTALGTLATNGALYWEGIDLDLVRTVGVEAWPKYPIHHTARPHTTSIFTLARLRCWSLATNGTRTIDTTRTPFGADSNPHSTTLLHQVTTQGGPWNTHGWAANTAPLTYVYSQVASQGNLVYSDLASGQADQITVQGSTAPGLTVTGANALTHISGSTLGTVTASHQDAATVDVASAFAGGLSAADRSYYGM